MEDFYVIEGEVEDDTFSEYFVEVSVMKDTTVFGESVKMIVWAQGFDSALTCGEVLSAVLL